MRNMAGRMIAGFMKLIYGTVNGLLYVIKVSLFRRASVPGGVRNIVIFRTGNIGDILCAVPAMAALRANFPRARTILLTSPGGRGRAGAKDLLSGASFLDGDITYYREDVSTLKGKARIFSILRKERFDLFVELPQDPAGPWTEMRNIIFSRVIGARYAFGFRVDTIRFFGRIQSGFLRFDNEVERLLKIVREEGLKAGEAAFPIRVPDDDRRSVDGLLSGLHGRKLVAINPGAGKARNIWPLERFAEVGRRILDNHDVDIVVIGGSGDEGRTAKLRNAIGGRSADLGNRMTVIQAIELLRRCSLLVSNDTGAVHMAAAARTPVVGIYTAWELKGKWYPYGPGNTVLRKEPPCHTCHSAECGAAVCLEMVNTEEVCGEADRILRRVPG